MVTSKITMGGIEIEMTRGDRYADFKIETPKKMQRWEGEFVSKKLGYDIGPAGWSFGNFESKRRMREGGNGFVYVTTWSVYEKPAGKS